VTSRESNPDLAQDRDRQTRSDRIVKTSRTKLRHVAGGLIAASVGTGLLAIAVRAGWGGSSARALEGATLFLAAAAYLAHVIAHHDDRRELLTRSILVSAFALWGIVQIAPGIPGNALLNDVVIVLFVVDLAILVTP
jgi:hypothetical protein